jgi:hypothetical protein
MIVNLKSANRFGPPEAFEDPKKRLLWGTIRRHDSAPY